MLTSSTTLAQVVPPINTGEAARNTIPQFQQLVDLLGGLTIAGVLFATGVVVIGGATWALAGKHNNGMGVIWGRVMVIGGFVGAIIIGAARFIVNTGFQVGS